MGQSLQIIGMGTVVVDEQMFMSSYPQWNTKTVIDSQRLQVGGPVPTALVFLARLGTECSFIGKWSDDSHGVIIEKDLLKEGLLLNHSIRVPGGASGFANVWVETNTGRRTIAFTRGSFPEISESEMDTSFFSKGGVLHLDGWSGKAAIKAAAKIKNLGGKVYLDAGSPKEEMKNLIPLVDVMICPNVFVPQFFNSDTNINSAAERLLEMGVRTVVFTHGEKGVDLFTKQQHIHQPSFKIKAVDTTGAGDVFCGGLIYALEQQMSTEEALRFASASAALKCKKIGNREALPNLEEIKIFLSR